MYVTHRMTQWHRMKRWKRRAMGCLRDLKGEGNWLLIQIIRVFQWGGVYRALAPDPTLPLELVAEDDALADALQLWT